MRSKLGKLLMALGIVLMLASAGLLLYNRREQTQAEEAAMAVMPEMVEVINQRIQSTEATQPLEIAVAEAPIREMPEERINGYRYIGFVGIPALELELPILSDWDYKKLNIAPCRYTGNLYADDLVLMAHNYPNHFGRLSDLTAGDTVTFTDMDGDTVRFEVIALDVLESTAIEEMTAGEFDLTLFTCTYGGKSRVTVRCDRIEE